MRITTHVPIVAAALVMSCANASAQPPGAIFDGRLDRLEKSTTYIVKCDKLKDAVTTVVNFPAGAPGELDKSKLACEWGAVVAAEHAIEQVQTPVSGTLRDVYTVVLDKPTGQANRSYGKFGARTTATEGPGFLLSVGARVYAYVLTDEAKCPKQGVANAERPLKPATGLGEVLETSAVCEVAALGLDMTSRKFADGMRVIAFEAWEQSEFWVTVAATNGYTTMGPGTGGPYLHSKGSSKAIYKFEARPYLETAGFKDQTLQRRTDGLPTRDSFVIRNGGGGKLVWTAKASGGTWLKIVQPESASGALEPYGLYTDYEKRIQRFDETKLVWEIDPRGLAPGEYAGAITVDAVGAQNAPRTLKIRLTVTKG